MVTAPKRLEEILVDAGIASAQDLERARRRMTERGGRLLTNLVAVRRVDDEAFARALGRALGLPVVGPQRLSRVAAPRTPSRRAALRALAIERVLLPIGATRRPRAVEVAMFDPTDAEAIDRLRAICGGVDVRIAVAPRRALLDAIGQTYGREAAGVVGGGDTGPHELFDDTDLADDDTPVDDTPGAPAGVELATDLQEDIARLGDPDAPTPPPVLLTSRDSRLTRTLLEVVGLLAGMVEERIARRPGLSRELARYSRLVARQLGCAPSVVDEIGVAAHLAGVEQALHEEAAASGAAPPDLADAFGWAAGSPDSVGPILRALQAAEDGFRGDDPPLGALVIGAVREYLQLVVATPDGQPDRATVVQLLRVTTPPEIIEALGRVLDAQEAEPTSKETSDVE